jgi:hypothetical protein
MAIKTHRSVVSVPTAANKSVGAEVGSVIYVSIYFND